MKTRDVCCLILTFLSICLLAKAVRAETQIKNMKTTETIIVYSVTEVEKTTESTTAVTTSTETTKELTTTKLESTSTEKTTRKEISGKYDKWIIAKLAMAEAEDEPEYSKRLTIDVILNRIDSKSFPNNAYDVAHQSGQFSVMTNGRYTRANVTDYMLRLVSEEIDNRTNSEVLYFQQGGYPSYATPVIFAGSHYYSK